MGLKQRYVLSDVCSALFGHRPPIRPCGLPARDCDEAFILWLIANIQPIPARATATHVCIHAMWVSNLNSPQVE